MCILFYRSPTEMTCNVNHFFVVFIINIFTVQETERRVVSDVSMCTSSDEVYFT